MKTAKEILDEVTKGCGIVSEQYILKAMEQYAQYKVNELNKSDVIKSVCQHKNTRIGAYTPNRVWCIDCDEYI
jgi:hypothetical protein